MNKYQIRTRTSVKLVSGEPVYLQYGVKAFVHEAIGSHFRFGVSEITTGFNISYGLTKESAIKRARSNLRKNGKKEIQKVIASTLKNWGEINQEWEETP